MAADTTLAVHVARHATTALAPPSWQSRSPLGPAWSVVEGGRLIVDGAAGHRLDSRGEVRVEGLAVGWHDAALEGPAPAEGPAPVLARFPVRLERGKMTLVLIELRQDGSFRSWARQGPRQVILEPLLRDLVSRSSGVNAWVEAFAGFLGGTRPPGDWGSLFVEGGRDEDGGFASMLAAHRYRVGVDGGRPAAVRSVVVDLGGPRVEAVVATDLRGGSFHRAVLLPSPTGPGGWRAASLGVDPSATAP